MKIKNNNIVSTKTKVADGSVMSSLTSKVMGQFDIFKHLVSTVVFLLCDILWVT